MEDLRIELLSMTIRRLEAENEGLQQKLRTARQDGYNEGVKNNKAALKKANKESERWKRIAEWNKRQRAYSDEAIWGLICDSVMGDVSFKTSYKILDAALASEIEAFKTWAKLRSGFPLYNDPFSSRVLCALRVYITHVGYEENIDWQK